MTKVEARRNVIGIKRSRFINKNAYDLLFHRSQIYAASPKIATPPHMLMPCTQTRGSEAMRCGGHGGPLSPAAGEKCYRGGHGEAVLPAAGGKCYRGGHGGAVLPAAGGEGTVYGIARFLSVQCGAGEKPISR